MVKSAFLVLGAQRSGTSVTSHILSKFGIDFGSDKHFIQGGHNPIFFELGWVNDANNQLIHALGYRYIDFFLPIEHDFEGSPFTEIERYLQAKIMQEWGDKPLIGLKDPRFSLTFPVWQRVLTAAGYGVKVVLAFRCPSSFLKSNQALFHNWEGWDTNRHLQFWLQLNLAATYFTRGLPVYFLCYEDLMTDPDNETEKLARCFNLDAQSVAHAAAVIDRAHYHHQLRSETGIAVVDDYFQQLCLQTVSADDYLNYRNTVLSGIS